MEKGLRLQPLSSSMLCQRADCWARDRIMSDERTEASFFLNAGVPNQRCQRHSGQSGLLVIANSLDCTKLLRKRRKLSLSGAPGIEEREQKHTANIHRQQQAVGAGGTLDRWSHCCCLSKPADETPSFNAHIRS